MHQVKLIDQLNYELTIVFNHKMILLLTCSYDTRGAHAGTPSHWREEEVLEDRAIFRTIREPAELIISPVLVSRMSVSLYSHLHFILYPKLSITIFFYVF